MKKIIRLLITAFSILYIHNIISQPYLEQNSGVSTRLTSVSVLQYPYPYWTDHAWICGYNGVVLRTTNFGINWVNKSGNGIPGNINLVNIFSFDSAYALTAGYSGTGTYVYRTSNGGSSWQQVFSQPNGFVNAIWMKTPLIGFMYGDPVGNRWSLWKTTSGGVNWDSSGMFLIQTSSETGWNNSLFVINNKIWFGTNSSKIYYSTNFGSNWTANSVSEANTYAIWIYLQDSLLAYRGSANSYKTTNGGTSWIIMNCPGTGNFVGFCSGVYGVENAQYPPSVSWTVRNDNKIYQNHLMGDWVTDYTAPSGSYTHIGLNYNGALNFTWAVRTDGGITRVVTAFVGMQEISSEIPNGFALSQNYPNPFNPSTKIRFDTPPQPSPKGREQLVRLVIYDVLGREIATLVNEQLQPGTYEVEWDAGNNTSGVYFYKLITTDYTETRKMVLVK